jgi:hypothetical protein
MQLSHLTTTGGFSCSLWSAENEIIAVYSTTTRATLSTIGNQEEFWKAASENYGRTRAYTKKKLNL